MYVATPSKWSSTPLPQYSLVSYGAIHSKREYKTYHTTVRHEAILSKLSNTTTITARNITTLFQRDKNLPQNFDDIAMHNALIITVNINIIIK